MKAILSDIHANLEALEAVLDDMAEFDVEALYCLGDIVGYGPNPAECLDVMMHAQVVLLGNHDEAARSEPQGFTPEAAASARWTQRQLREVLEDGEAPQDRFHFLTGLPQTHREGDFLFVHGSPRDPLWEYVYPHDVRDAGKMWALFRQVKRYCIMGHTHIPGVITEANKFHSPEDFDGVWKLDDRKILCNVGSVGQPRDKDWRACYVILDDDALHFRRVEWDINTTLKKIKRIPELKSVLSYYKT
jgi:predicted phosphodiesterase